MRRTTMQNEKRISDIRMEGARLVFRNFSGKESDYNEAGNRNFGLVIDPEDVSRLRDDGWNVKSYRGKNADPDDEPLYYLPVKVKYGKIPPIITMITSRGKIRLDEEDVNQLDWTIMRNVDVVVRPYHYPAMPGRKEGGVSAYLKSLYVEIEEDDFDLKYADVPDLN